MALPFLPGNSFNPSLGKTKFHKSHHFDYTNDVAMMVGESKSGIGGELLRGQKPRNQNSAIPRGSGTDLPAWVAFDRQVLCFDGYFQEAVHEKREEQYRIRNCKIYFYLEDDSIQVIEPRLKNSGTPQGTLIRRHRIPRPAPHDDSFYTVEDFNVGKEVTMYSRTFKLTGCDKFTENFLGKLGVRVSIPSEQPCDPYSDHRKALDESMQPLRPYEKHDILKQFLDHDRHVLRFFCFWDDTDNMFGDPRDMVLHYFLADDTIEIREIIPPNSGRDATPMFLRRAKLPKEVESLKQPGVATDRTVLNVFGPTGHGGRYILDSLKTGAVSQEFIKDSDLTIGGVINVWGRPMVIVDCDDFTRNYYRTKYGITDFKSLDCKQPSQPPKQREVPPYNGFGSEEDSLCSCMGLLPKPPKRDFIKFMEKDRHGLDSNVIRFLAKMNTSKPIDEDRRFIISYFLSDDTILVFEPPVRNSGVVSGKFLERSRVKKPGQEPYGTHFSEYYTATDLFVGAEVEFNKHKFTLIDADDYAYNYMERHADEFPQSNVKMILAKLKQCMSGVQGPNVSGSIPFEQFRQHLLQLAQGQLSEHEIHTVARCYQDHKDDTVSLKTLVTIAQEQLRKINFENFSKLEEQCLHYDKERCGVLNMDDVRTVCNALKVPLQDDLLRALISKMSDEGGKLRYADFVQCLNWRDHSVGALATNGSGDSSNWKGNSPANQINCVNVQQLFADLTGGQ